MKAAIALHGENKISACAGKTLFCLVFALLFLAAGAVHGQSAVETAMLATDITSVDASVAAAAASDKGIPVLIAEDGMLSDEIKSELASLGVKTVVLVGGPAVIKPETEQQLRDLGYKVVRLWGFERTGTAIAVARYFYPEGAGCAVLVDDTKNSDADAKRQWTASNLAAKFNCTLVPVPEGTLPAEVLDTLKELNVQEVWFVGKRFMVGDKLREFRVRAIEGGDDEVEDEVGVEIENATVRNKLKVVIVATPDWKAAIAIGAHPNHDAVVRMISNPDQAQDIINLIKEKNITDVKVVGLPDLAQQVADRLQQNGINATVISGQRARHIAKELAEKFRLEWRERRLADENDMLRFRLRIRASAEADINETLAKLDAALAELDSLNATNATESAKAAIEAAKARIQEVRSLLASGSLDDARRLLYELKFKADEEKYELREKLKIKIEDEIKDEEDDIDEVQADVDKVLSAVESRLGEVRSRCANTDIVDAIIEKAKSLRTAIQNASADGNFTGAAKHLRQVRELVDIAHSIAERCRHKGEVPSVARAIITREGIKARIEERIEKGEGTSGSSASTQEFEIEADDFGMYAGGEKVTSISVSKGNRVKIEFKMRTTSTSFGGLDFKSPAGNLLGVKPGSSGEIEFTANSSFTVTSYWPGTTVPKATLDILAV